MMGGYPISAGGLLPNQAGYTDQYGNFISTGVGYAPPLASSCPIDPSEEELNALRRLNDAQRICLREAYIEIGSLHQQIKGLTQFDKFSEERSAMAGLAQPKL